MSIAPCNCECCQRQSGWIDMGILIRANTLIESPNTNIQKLFDEIKHGDAEHQLWLKEKLEAFFNVKLQD